MQRNAASLSPQPATPAFTPRQSAVLQTALNMLVEGGDRALTTAAVARAANCSKESLYKWFGDRDGLLAAVVTYQASKVRAQAPVEAPASEAALREHLILFGDDLLRVLAGDVSLALNRLAIGQAGNREPQLGELILSRGRRPIGQRAVALLEMGRRQGFLAIDDAEDAYRTLYGLIVGDLHVRLLLGEKRSGQPTFRAQAETAVDRFFRLYRTRSTQQA